MSLPPDPVSDTRAILDPSAMAQVAQLQRFPVPAECAGILDWTWSVQWQLPAGACHRQNVLSLPAVNISVGTGPPPGAEPHPGTSTVSPRVVGVARSASTRMLTGSGWNVAVKTTVGGFGALINAPVAELTDREVPMASVLPIDAETLAHAMDEAASAEARAALLSDATSALLERADQGRVRAAREVSGLADAAAQHRELRVARDLARHGGLSVRTLQRLFLEYAGVSPAWVLRRLRLIEAAERAARGEPVLWAQVAAELGYADQAHLSRDFAAAIGRTPSAYAADQRR